MSTRLLLAAASAAALGAGAALALNPDAAPAGAEPKAAEAAAAPAPAESKPAEAAPLALKTGPEDAAPGVATSAPALAPAPDGVQIAALAEKSAADLPVPDGVDAALVKAEIDKASAWLNSVKTLRGRFLQIAPDGSVAQGAVFLDRPNRARIEYDPPHPSLIVSDGATVAHLDRDLETVDRAPIRSSPLHVFIKDNVDLVKDADITDISLKADALALTVRDPEAKMEGELTLVFAQPNAELREWIVTDALGESTRVTLVDVVRGEKLDASLFVLREEKAGRRRER